MGTLLATFLKHPPRVLRHPGVQSSTPCPIYFTSALLLVASGQAGQPNPQGTKRLPHVGALTSGR